MKMKDIDFQILDALIHKTMHEEGTSLQSHRAEYAARDLSARRARWDCLWLVPRGELQAWFDRGIYGYLNDDHINTALKRIVGG